ncbi:MAG TPA: plasmid stabilization protein [Roseococcus sp.]|nr:plasmid stabilization protein [Roseococcus sp.]
MPQGSKAKYTDKQKRKAEHIEESYEARGVPHDEAEARAWATVNAQDGGGKKSGSGRAKPAAKTAAPVADKPKRAPAKRAAAAKEPAKKAAPRKPAAAMKAGDAAATKRAPAPRRAASATVH